MFKANMSQQKTQDISYMSQKELINYYNLLAKKKENIAELIYYNPGNPLLNKLFAVKNRP